MLVTSSNMNSQTLLHYFRFNNSLANEAGTSSFTGGNSNTYGIGMDVTNIGKRVQNGDMLSCNLSNLPQGNQARSISFWAYFYGGGPQFILSYGSAQAQQAYGVTQQPSNLIHYSWANDLTTSTAYNTGSWYHYVCTYDGTQMKIYRNNVLQGTYTVALNTTGTTLHIGSALGNNSQNTINASIDELQIYSGAITPEQVSYLYTIGGPLQTAPIISAVNSSANGTATATIDYSLNANGSATASVVKYGTSSSSLTNQVTGFSASGSATTPGSATLTGLVPGTVYYYQVEATNSNGTTNSAVASFSNVQMLGIAEYNFNNTLANVTGGNAFTQNTFLSYVADRNGNANSALNINNVGTTATIPDLPYGLSPRTVSVWIRMNAVNSNYNFIYNYGYSAGYNGAFFSSATLYHFATNENHSYTTSTLSNEWIHFAFSYDGSQSKIYKNGVLVGTSSVNFNTINNANLFRLGLTENGGSGYFNGAIDDLKIFGSALSDTDIASLFTNNTLSSENFNLQNLQATIFPNPATDNFSIETENEVKSVEIYSLQGQKVLTSTSKDINVSDLSKGMYLVRIEDENNAVATQKLIVK